MPEQVACYLCGETRPQLLYRFGEVAVVKCPSCGLVYTSPRLTASERRPFYSEHYLDSDNGLGMDVSYLQMGNVARDDARVRLREMGAFHPQKGRLLEIGCATGEFLQVAQEQGWVPFGVDCSEQAIEACRQKGLSNVLTEELTEQSFPEKRFDVVVLYHTLEHLEDPRRTLRIVASRLEYKGLVVITVPDIESTSSKKMGQDWFALQPKTHLFHFSKRTLSRLLEQAGFRVFAIKRIGGTGWIKRGAQKGEGSVENFAIRYLAWFIWLRRLVQFIQVDILRQSHFFTVFARKD